jgi:NADH:ubiquinone oxidoreductase subunit C
MLSLNLFLLKKQTNYFNYSKIKLLYKLLNINFNSLQKNFNLLYLFIKHLSKYLMKVTITNSELILYLKNNFDILVVLSFLKLHYTLQFKELVDICTVDFCFSQNFFNRFELNYILLSLINKCHIRVKINTSIESNIISLCKLYSSSN